MFTYTDTTRRPPRPNTATATYAPTRVMHTAFSLLLEKGVVGTAVFDDEKISQFQLSTHVLKRRVDGEDGSRGVVLYSVMTRFTGFMGSYDCYALLGVLKSDAARPGENRLLLAMEGSKRRDPALLTVKAPTFDHTDMRTVHESAMEEAVQREWFDAPTGLITRTNVKGLRSRGSIFSGVDLTDAVIPPYTGIING